MTDKKSVSSPGFSADWLFGGALSRIGDTLDRFTGRRWTPSSSLATSELIERVKKLLDSEAKDVEGKGRVVPHNIKLKVQWDKFSTDAEGALVTLENELLTAAADHINDCLYYTYEPLRVEVKPDYFTEGVKLFVSFDRFIDDDHEAQLNVTIPSIKKADLVPTQEPPSRGASVFIARFELRGNRRDKRFEFPGPGRISVGRTSASDLVIDDPSVSKIHASVVIDGEGRLSVADTGSTNGTFINDERIAYGKAVAIGRGDRVKFGSIGVVFEQIAQVEPEQPSSRRLSQENTVRIDDLSFTSKQSSPDAIPPPEDILKVNPAQKKG